MISRLFATRVRRGWSNRRRVVRAQALLAAFCASLGLAGAAASPVAEPSAPSLWRVADADSEVWILGSVHMLPPDEPWRNAAIDAAYAAAEIVYFEVSTDAVDAEAVQRLVLAEGVNPPGVSLAADLSDAGQARLADVAARIGRRVEELDLFQPWLAYLLVEAGLFARDGAAPQFGVDVVLQNEARRDGKSIRFFETVADQVDLLSGLPPATQIALLERTLEAHDETPEVASALMQAWRGGDDAALAALVFEAEAEFPLFFDAMFHRRNRAWADEIDTLLQGSGTAFIVVGAGHLVGRENVIELLAAEGYSVERR